MKKPGCKSTPVVVARLALLAVKARAADWPQWRGPNRDGVWNGSGILETFPTTGLEVRWRAPVGYGFSNPIVAQGRVYVTDSRGSTGGTILLVSLVKVVVVV